MNRIPKPWLHFIVAFVATTPSWIWFAKRVVDGSDEPWGVVTLVAVAFLLWNQREEITSSYSTPMVTLSGIVIYALFLPFLPSLLLAVIAVAILAASLGTVGRRPGVIALFALSLPLEASLQFYAGYPMRKVATEISSVILKTFGLPVETSGTSLLDGDSVVSVAPACAGIQMLWLSLALTGFLTALRRTGWGRCFALMCFTVLLVIVTNSLRISALFFKETGRMDLPDWAHEGIGLLAFGLLIPVLLRLGGKQPCLPARPAETSTPSFSLPWKGLLAAAIAIACIPVMFHESDTEKNTAGIPDWPKQWNGEWLEPVPLSEFELAFAKDFPGHISAFRAGQSRIILREVLRPTRKLHPSQDCFRASGFSIIGEDSGKYEISKNGHVFQVHEAIHETNLTKAAKWHHPSDWYWEALFAKSKAPWLAITVISPAKNASTR